MLISVLGFGSIWTRRAGVRGGHAACYNTTGVSVRDRLRHRPRVYGIARFDGQSGFRPDFAHRMIHKVFDCEPPCVWAGRNKVLFKSLLAHPLKPDAYLVVVTAEQTGGIDKEQGGIWLHPGAQLISVTRRSRNDEFTEKGLPYRRACVRANTYY